MCPCLFYPGSRGRKRSGFLVSGGEGGAVLGAHVQDGSIKESLVFVLFVGQMNFSFYTLLLMDAVGRYL